MSGTPSHFDTSTAVVIKRGNRLTPRPRGKNWRAYFDSPTRGSLPERHQPPLDERTGLMRVPVLREEDGTRESSA